MHPKLEDPEQFSGFHNGLITNIHYWLAARLPKQYIAAVETNISLHGLPGAVRRYGPDADIRKTLESPSATYTTAQPIITDPEFFMEFLLGKPQRYLTIREGSNQVITTIEILSPANKCESGFSRFKRKQDMLHDQGIHLLEIDLLQRGKRRWTDPRALDATYLLTVYRGYAEDVEV